MKRNLVLIFFSLITIFVNAHPKQLAVTQDGDICFLNDKGQAICSANKYKSYNDRTYQTIGAGKQHFCAKTTEGEVDCWGINSFGELGNLPESYVSKKERINQPKSILMDDNSLLIVDDLVVGRHSNYGLKKGLLLSWGSNEYGQLGLGFMGGFTNIPSKFSQTTLFNLVSATSHVCGMTTDGSVSCFGRGTSGQLGDGNFTTSPTLTEVKGLAEEKVVGIFTGYNHSCVLVQNKTDAKLNNLYCWGENCFGQLGIGNKVNQGLPVKVIGSESFEEVALGTDESCAITSDHRVFCWGDNSFQRLGVGSSDNEVLEPKAIENTKFTAIATAGYDFFGITLDKKLVKWGNHTKGKIQEVFNISEKN